MDAEAGQEFHGIAGIRYTLSITKSIAVAAFPGLGPSELNLFKLPHKSKWPILPIKGFGHLALRHH